jgi:hypothetical protein
MTHVRQPLYIAPRVSGSRMSDAGGMGDVLANGATIRAMAAVSNRAVIRRIADTSG